ISFADVADRVSGSHGNGGVELPEPPNERQARALAALPKPMQRDVWSDATQGGTKATDSGEIARLGAKAMAGLSAGDRLEPGQRKEKAIVAEEGCREARDGIEKIKSQM